MPEQSVVCVGQSGTGTVFSLRDSASSYQFSFTIAFIILLVLSVLQMTYRISRYTNGKKTPAFSDGLRAGWQVSGIFPVLC